MIAFLMLVAAVTLPAPLTGVWAKDLAACGKEDTDGVLIAPTTVTFYEARGKVRTVSNLDQHTISAVVDYEGEGRHWSEANTFRLTGDALEISALGQTTRLLHCSAQPGN